MQFQQLLLGQQDGEAWRALLSEATLLKQRLDRQQDLMQRRAEESRRRQRLLARTFLCDAACAAQAARQALLAAAASASGEASGKRLRLPSTKALEAAADAAAEAVLTAAPVSPKWMSVAENRAGEAPRKSRREKTGVLLGPSSQATPPPSPPPRRTARQLMLFLEQERRKKLELKRLMQRRLALQQEERARVIRLQKLRRATLRDRSARRRDWKPLPEEASSSQDGRSAAAASPRILAREKLPVFPSSSLNRLCGLSLFPTLRISVLPPDCPAAKSPPRCWKASALLDELAEAFHKALRLVAQHGLVLLADVGGASRATASAAAAFSKAATAGAASLRTRQVCTLSRFFQRSQDGGDALGAAKAVGVAFAGERDACEEASALRGESCLAKTQSLCSVEEGMAWIVGDRLVDSPQDLTKAPSDGESPGSRVPSASLCRVAVCVWIFRDSCFASAWPRLSCPSEEELQLTCGFHLQRFQGLPSGERSSSCSLVSSVWLERGGVRPVLHSLLTAAVAAAFASAAGLEGGGFEERVFCCLGDSPAFSSPEGLQAVCSILRGIGAVVSLSFKQLKSRVSLDLQQRRQCLCLWRSQPRRFSETFCLFSQRVLLRLLR